MNQFTIVENYKVTGSQSVHDRAYASLEVARAIHLLANKHFEWLLKHGGTVAEIEDAAEGLSREVGFAMLKVNQPDKCLDTRRGIEAYMTRGGKMEKN